MGTSRKQEILLAIDVGNTSALCGFFKLTRPQKFLVPFDYFRVPTDFLNRSRSIEKAWKSGNALRLRPVGVIISSVVPRINKPLKAFLSKLYGAPIKFVTSKSTGILKIRFKVPSELGADRIVNGRGALAYSKKACIVVDFGTATTFDCLSRDQKFIGGVIAPGPIISAEALYQRTAKLPLVKLSRPVPVIGKNTLESILSGLYHGYRGLVHEIVSQIKKKLGSKTTLLATGGQAPLILNGLPEKFKFLPFLTLTGLLLLWQDEYGKKVVSHRG